jgi:hypothetical protein
MSHQRTFDFPVAVLLGGANRLLAALRDPTAGPAVLKRFKQGYDATFQAQITLVEKGGGDQSTAGGALTELTDEQGLAYTEMERLMSGARASAMLVFAKGDPRLHTEFTVGAQEQSHDLDHELQYANIILKACQTYAAQLAEHGWTADDTTALSTNITTLEGAVPVHDTANDTKKRITSGRNAAASVLYKQCLSVQNAARLAYPVSQAGKVAGITENRARFLLDEFPPKGGTTAAPAPTPAPAATK